MYKKILILFFSIAALTLYSQQLNAGLFSQKEAGTTAAQFLKIGCGARAIGMGEAYTAVANDASAIYWNPAGLYGINSFQITAMHAVWFENINYDFLAFAHPLCGGAIGVSLNYLSMSKMDRLDENGEQEGSFAPYDAAASIAYSRNIIGNLAGGVTFKYIKQSLDEESASGYAMDAGANLRLCGEKIRVGFAVQNIGSKMKFIDEGYSLPLSIRTGISWKAGEKFLLSCDGVAPIDNDPNVHFGCEYLINTIQSLPIALRAGYKTTTVADLDSLAGLSGGIGFKAGMLSIDYAWVPYGDLGDTHRISLSFDFSRPENSGNVKKDIKNRTSHVKAINKPLKPAGAVNTAIKNTNKAARKHLLK